MSKGSFNNMKPFELKNWRCQACLCKLPKTNNTETPVRQSNKDIATTSVDSCNITIRRTQTNTKNVTVESDDLNLTVSDF
ncbi:unnamed protein product [Arctia plantaginis]|uniref:Uncharacterized protein n=1 Tax=Arctia plantaginis TaxID=874455 RepID=A0A8S0ZQT1_ARCPL|nr:unnamed protein product [Arctia plantaginis]